MPRSLFTDVDANGVRRLANRLAGDGRQLEDLIDLQHDLSNLDNQTEIVERAVDILANFLRVTGRTAHIDHIRWIEEIVVEMRDLSRLLEDREDEICEAGDNGTPQKFAGRYLARPKITIGLGRPAGGDVSNIMTKILRSFRVIEHDAAGHGRDIGDAGMVFGADVARMVVGEAQGEDRQRGADDWRPVTIDGEVVAELRDGACETTLHIDV